MKRAIFVRSKMTIMAELEKRAREKGIYKVTLWGSFANFLLVIFKFLAGIAGHSAAMMADAVHSLSDFVTDVVVILFVRISNKPQDKGHDYGHGKYETLATALIGVALLGVGCGILWNGAGEILAFMRGEQLRAPGVLALIAALVSILLKEILYQYHCPYGQKVQLSSSDCQCMASSERCIVFYRNGFRYWRSYSARSSLGGARPYCRRDSQFLYNESVCQALGPLY